MLRPLLSDLKCPACAFEMQFTNCRYHTIPRAQVKECSVYANRDAALFLAAIEKGDLQWIALGFILQFFTPATHSTVDDYNPSVAPARV